VAVVALIFVGISAYGPVAGFISQQLNQSPEQFVPPEETPPPPPVEVPPPPPPEETESLSFPDRPEYIKAVLMNRETASDPDMWEEFAREIIREYNTVMVEIKNADGYVLFNSSNQRALAWGAVTEDTVDLSALAEFLLERQLYLAVSMSSFLDPIAARADRLNNAIIHRPTGQIWLDNTLDLGGRPWLNPFSASAREYLMQIALEAADMGAVLVVFDNYHFPLDVTNSADFGYIGGFTRSQVLTAFADEMHYALGERDIRFAVQMPWWVLNYPDGANFAALYAGNPADIALEILLDVDPERLPADSISDVAEYLAARLPAWLEDRNVRVLGAVDAREDHIATVSLMLGLEDANVGISDFVIR